MTQFEELTKIVAESLCRAEQATLSMKLSESHARHDRAGTMVSDVPRFKQLALGFGSDAWSTILFVDLRGSTARARSVGAKKTYLTMHALLPALAFAVQEHDGYIVGFRGDGLFAAFGLNENGHNFEGYDQGKIVQRACACGRWMIEGVSKVVNPALDERDCRGNIHIGVGIDSGTVIFTRIGLYDGFEITAYGDAVNHASKITDLSDNNVCVSAKVNSLFPVSKGGQVKVSAHPRDPEVHVVQHPNDLLTKL